MEDYLIGVDIGTSSIKAVLTTPVGEIVARSTVHYPTHHPQPGWAEQDPEHWWKGAVEAIRSVTAGYPGRVAGIGVSGQGCGVTLVDQAGDVIRPAIIWMDSRSEPQCERLRQCCLEEVLVQNGKSPAPYNADPVLLWLIENEPESIRRAETSLTTTAYLNFRLTGQKVANRSDASLLMAFDLAAKTWSEELIEKFEIPRRLYLPLADCAEVIGELTPAAAQELGLQAGIPVVAGGEDTSSAGMAMGAVKEGYAFLSLGTAGTVYMPTTGRHVRPELLTFLHVLEGQYLIGGSMAALGASLSWLHKLLGQDREIDSLIDLAAQSQPGAGGLIFLPYMSGELQPINDGYARGMFFGLSLSTELKDIVRAVLEGTAYAVAHNLALIESLGIPITEVRAVGGPTRSALWCQIIADVIGRPLHVVSREAGAPLGNALLAGQGVGLIENAAGAALQAARVEHSHQPDMHKHEHYQRMFEVYCQLYPQVKEQYARLAQL